MQVELNGSQTCATGVPGLDTIIRGGLPKNQIYLLQGKPGTGKTTLAIQFLLEGVRRGERSLYITFSETSRELDAVALAHNWDLSQISVLELLAISDRAGKASQTTLFHSSEIELNKVINFLTDKIKELNPHRIVFDSVSELRLLADTSLKYRRQMLSFKEFFSDRQSTVLFLDDMTSEAGDLHVQSIVHGVLVLEKIRAGYGVERRELHIAKLRGVDFRGGTHDYRIEKGGIRVFPRLVAAQEVENIPKTKTISSGIKELDQLLGGGLESGTSNLILGPAGSGKSTIALRFAVSAAQSGKKVALYSFDESIATLSLRANSLGLNLDALRKSGNLEIRKVDPAELTPGQFAAFVKESAHGDADMIIIDSLNGYIQAMPEQKFLTLQLHELLSYLGNRGIVTIIVLAQAGIMSSMSSPVDITYLADSVILTRFFEAFGKVRKAISVIKKRTSAHEETLREFRVGPGGIVVGKVLEEFSGIFTGVPKFTGPESKMIKDTDA